MTLGVAFTRQLADFTVLSAGGLANAEWLQSKTLVHIHN